MMTRSPTPWLPLIALTVGTFGIGTTEFSPMGMLPDIADGVGVSIPAAGMLVSAYAVGVMVGAPLMTLLLTRVPRRTALIFLMVIFCFGNFLSAVAPGYLTLFIARVVTSFSHGAFIGIGSVVATSLVPRERQASAVAVLFLGLTVANIIGVPAATWIGQAVGWRQSFALTAVLGLVAIIGLGLYLPKLRVAERSHVRNELAVLKRSSVLIPMLTTVLSAGAVFTTYTYIAPTLSQLTVISAKDLTMALAVIGCGFFVGNVISGKLADHSIDGCLIGSLTLLAIVSVVLPWAGGSRVGTLAMLFMWGIAAFGMVSPLQTRVMLAASDAPNLAASMNIGAFNVGNALGAALGGAAIAVAQDYVVIPKLSAWVCVCALLVVIAHIFMRGKSAAMAVGSRL